MFVLTVNKKNTFKILAGLLAFAVLGFAGVKIKNSLFKNRETSASVNGGEMTTTSQMAEYILSKGYTVDLQSAQVKEVKIPKKFDAEFENFDSKIQMTDGLSLAKLKNKKVNKWTFDITDYDVQGKTATAVLLIRKDKLVGAYILQQPEGLACPMARQTEREKTD